MNTHFFTCLSLGFAGMLAISSCSRLEIENESEKPVTILVDAELRDIWKNVSKQITTRAEDVPEAKAGDTFFAYLFNSKGKHVSRRGNIIGKPCTVIGNTQYGKHTIYCVTGFGDGNNHTFPNFSPNDTITQCTFSISKLADVCWGKTEVTTTATKIEYTTTVRMNHVMAKLGLTITDVPTDVDSVIITLPAQANTLKMDGTLVGDSQEQVLKLTKKEETNPKGFHDWVLPENTIIYPCAKGTKSMPIKIHATTKNKAYNYNTSSTTCCNSGTRTTLTAKWAEVNSQFNQSASIEPWTGETQTGSFEFGTLEESGNK